MRKIQVANEPEKVFVKDLFIEADSDIYVKTREGVNRVSKLFIKGLSDSRKITFNDNSVEVISATHRFMGNDGNWVYSPEMKVGMEFLNIFEPNKPLTIKSIETGKDYLVDMEVEDCHEYISKSGLVNHNTLSWLANVSGGIEPLFALRYFRKVEIGVDKQGNAIYRNEAVLDPILLQWCESHNKDVSKILEYLEANNGSLQKCSLLTEQEQELFKIANELSVDEHLRILAAATRSVSCSVSKTINLPNKITKEQMGDVFLEAWKMGIIGVTVYRDGCREGILTTSAESPKAKVEERPKELPAEMYHFNLRSTITDEKGKEHSVTRPYYVCVAVMNGMPYEIFSSMSNHTEPGRENDTYVPKHLKTGKIVKVKAGNYDYIEDGTGETVHITGKHTLPESNLINRLVSLSLRNDVDLEEIYEQLTKVNAITDYGQVIARYIKKFLKDGAKTGHKCPSCGTDMIRMEGCLKCGSCGVSKCG